MKTAQPLNTLSYKAFEALRVRTAFLRTPSMKADADAILFSAKSFAAAMLAYYISLRIGLPKPFLGHRHCLHRLADVRRSVAQPWCVSLCRDVYRRDRDGRDNPKFHEQPGRMQCDARWLDRSVPEVLLCRVTEPRLSRRK